MYKRKFGYRKFKKYGKRAIGFSRGVGTVASSALTALKMAKELKSIVNVERKFIETQPSGTASTSGTMFLLTGIPQGVGENERNGDKVKLQSISYKLLAQYTGTGCIVRVILFKDKVSNGIVPSASELLHNVSSLGHYNVDNCPSRFEILMDKRRVMNSANLPFIQESTYKKIYHHLTFKGTTLNQTDAATGHLYMFIITDTSVTPPTFGAQIRVTYVDN